jgi:hypothetical protein
VRVVARGERFAGTRDIEANAQKMLARFRVVGFRDVPQSADDDLEPSLFAKFAHDRLL